MNLTIITNLWPPFEAEDFYVPIVHFHEIEGPSKKLHKLMGSSNEWYAVTGSQTVHELLGPSNEQYELAGSQTLHKLQGSN